MTAARKLALLGLWTMARFKLFLRTPRTAFFTFVFPLILLALLDSLNGGQTITGANGVKVSFAAYFTPSIGIFGLVTACYTATIFAIATARDRGIIKRVMGTPLPTSIYLASWGIAAIMTGFVSVALLVVIGLLAFSVSIDPALIPAAVVIVLLGGTCLSALGLAVSSFVRKAESAPMVANLTMFPVVFLSGVFFPISEAPDWLQKAADVFPVAHLVDAFASCFDPSTTGSGFSNDLWSLVAWTAVGLFVATRRFRVEMTAAGGDSRRPAMAGSG
jgi:ABC-2 type transport system permease protein